MINANRSCLNHEIGIFFVGKLYVYFLLGGWIITKFSHLDQRERLIELFLPVVEKHGATLVDLELTGSAGNLTLRLLVHKNPATALNLCQNISFDVEEILDDEDPFPGHYRLEVTSPGLSRVLCTDQDFDRALSRGLKVVMSSGKTLHGRLVGYGNDYITLESIAGTKHLKRGEIAHATIRVGW